MNSNEKQRLESLAMVLKALAHETRLKILSMLNNQPQTWTEMLNELNINSKSLRDHLQYLRDRDLVKKSDTVGFEITSAGKLLLEISLKEILDVIELAEQPTFLGSLQERDAIKGGEVGRQTLRRLHRIRTALRRIDENPFLTEA